MSRITRLQGSRAALPSALAAILLCACSGSGTDIPSDVSTASMIPSHVPSATSSPGETMVVELVLGPDGLTPATIEVERGTDVRMEITTERTGVLHVEEYGYAISELSPGEVTTIEFTADHSSPIVLHVSGGDDEEIGTLTVAEEE